MSYKVNDECWFIGEYGRWYRCKVAAKSLRYITIQSMTGYDAEQQVQWPYPDGLSFRPIVKDALYLRLRPADARPLK